MELTNFSLDFQELSIFVDVEKFGSAFPRIVNFCLLWEFSVWQYLQYIPFSK